MPKVKTKTPMVMISFRVPKKVAEVLVQIGRTMQDELGTPLSESQIARLLMIEEIRRRLGKEGDHAD